MKIYTPGESKPPTRVALYGAAKSGKTRLATSLPWGLRWGERAIYVAFDPGAEELGSVLTHNRDRLIVVKPGPTMVNGKLKYDPLKEAVTIATHDWKKDYPDVNTIIIDTVTELSRQLLNAYADSGTFSEKHVTFGTPGTPEYHAQPMEGDYGGAQRSTMFVLQYLDRQPLSKVLVFHDEWIEPREGSVGTVFGGPALAGKAGTKMVAGYYDNLFRIDTNTTGAAGGPAGARQSVQYRVATAPRGIWLAGFRHGGLVNPIPLETLDPDPITFWQKYESVSEGKAIVTPQARVHATP